MKTDLLYDLLETLGGCGPMIILIILVMAVVIGYVVLETRKERMIRHRAQTKAYLAEGPDNCPICGTVRESRTCHSCGASWEKVSS